MNGMYERGWATYKIGHGKYYQDWEFLKGFLAALADYNGEQYESVKEALNDYFGIENAVKGVYMIEEKTKFQTEWFRYPNLPLR